MDRLLFILLSGGIPTYDENMDNRSFAIGAAC